MKRQPDIAAAIRRWVEKAEHDLRNAEYVLTLKENCPTDEAVSMAREARKAVRALLPKRVLEQGE